MRQGPPRRRRPRPVADAPVEELLARDEDLAKGWLLDMLEQAPLARAGGILAGEVAEHGPSLCAAVVRAISADTELRRLEPGGALEPLAARAATVAGAVELEDSMRAVDALGAVVWSAVRAELPAAEGDHVAELAERLGLVMEEVRGAALRGIAHSFTAEPVAPPEPKQPGPLREVPPPPAEPPAEEPPSKEPAGPPEETPGPPPDEPEDLPPAAELAPPFRTDALWKGALGDEVNRAERSGLPLSLLLIELDDSGRLVAASPPAEAAATFGRFAQSVRAVVRRQDVLAAESDSRAWVIARDTSRLGAYSLGRRLVGAVRASAPWRGAPLSVNVGFSVLREDAADVEAMIEAAEEACLSAAASGVGVVPDIEPPGGPGDRAPTDAV